MNFAQIPMILGLTLLLPAAAMAAGINTTAAKNLPNASEVTISGTVEDFDSRHPFTLRDNTGSIQVDLSSAKPIVLHNGQQVTITGETDKDLFGTNVVASNVQMDTGTDQKVGSAAGTMEPLPTRTATGVSQAANANGDNE